MDCPRRPNHGSELRNGGGDNEWRPSRKEEWSSRWGRASQADTGGIWAEGKWGSSGDKGTGSWGGKKSGSKGSKDSGQDSEEDLLVFELGVQLPLEVEGVPWAQILEYGVVINRKLVKVMLDSGASVNAIAAEVVDRVGGVITPARERVRFADQRVIHAEGLTQLEMRHRGHVSKVTCLIVLRLGSEVILGRPWLKEWNPLIDWLSGNLTFSDGVQWRSFKGQEKALGDEGAKNERVSTLRLSEKAKRRVWEDIQRESPAPEKLSDVLPDHLKEYEDVFENPN